MDSRLGGSGCDTDHLTVYAQFRMPRVPNYDIQSYSYYHLEPRSLVNFGAYLDDVDWTKATTAQDVDCTAKLPSDMRSLRRE